MNSGKVALIIMDGWGEAPASSSNAVTTARTTFINELYRNAPHSKLMTCGDDVGLPDGQMGNSEVGHLNIGAGRVVYQELALINKSIRDKQLDEDTTIAQLCSYCNRENKPLHFIGLVSDGGVHSHTDHLVALCRIAQAKGVKQVFIHAFTDGRDTDPQSGKNYLEALERAVNPFGALVVSIVGRYYSMDRDKRWERVRLAYDLLVKGKGSVFPSVSAAMSDSYNNGVTDEFVKPVVIASDKNSAVTIKPDDAVMCFNFRTDRCREITQVLTQSEMSEHKMKPLSLYYVTMTRYDSTFRDVHVVFEKDNLSDTLGEVIARSGKTQLRIAETEKYPHVTFFFSGGREVPFQGEERLMVPSPKVATYDLKPSMSAFELRDVLLPLVKKAQYDFICLNFANADMVGHTGVFQAAVEAVETVDRCVGEIVREGLKAGYDFIITADHGNADMMVNPDGTPNTAHTLNPVPCFFVTNRNKDLRIRNGRLADLAPTVLELMGLDVPATMNGKSLLH